MDADYNLNGDKEDCHLSTFPDSDSPRPTDDEITANVKIITGKENESDQRKSMDSEHQVNGSVTELEGEKILIQNEICMKYEAEGYSEECAKTELPSQNIVFEFPLDVQIQESQEKENEEDKEEEEVQEPGGFEGLTVKVELIDNVDEFNKDIVPDDEGESVDCDVKAEPLEENYVDRITTLLEVVNSNDVNQGHFLTVQARPRRHKGAFKCVNCSASFKYQSTYDYHVNSECGSKMIAESNKLVHKGKNQSFTCNVCHKEMCSRTSLMVHMRIHNGERPFACDVCNRAFIQKAHLRDHVKIHINQTVKSLIHTCVECGQVFGAKKFLQEHMQLHFGDKIYDCDVCHKRFRTRSNLSTHKIIHSDKKKFCCVICSKEFLRRPNLDEHMRVHTKEKPFICDICGKTFAEKSRRNTHVKRHTGELRQVCSVCGKKFACSYDLRVHQRSHTGEKPFSCNICGRMFNRKSIMETHMTIHTGRKDFVCLQCGEAFNRKSKLDVHLADHTGEKFFCEICHKVFKCKAYLIPHIRTHFGERRKKSIQKPNCLLCHSVFKSSQKLQQHINEKHPTLFETNFIKVEQVEGEID